MNCNLRCSMCPWLSFHSQEKAMPWGVFQTVAHYFKDTKEVDLTGGGEPLLHPRLEDMVALAKESGCLVGFSTNGTLLGEEEAYALMEAGLDWIAFSIEGATEQTYEKIRVGASFRKVMKNMRGIQGLKEKKGVEKPRTMLFFVMQEENFHELPAAVEMAHSLGIGEMVAKNLDVLMKKGDDKKKIFMHGREGEADPFIFQSVEEAKRKAGDLKMPLRVYELYPVEKPICEQDPLNTLFVAWDGSVSPCISLSYMEERWFGGKWRSVPVLRFGNLAEEPLEVIWEKLEYQNFRRKLKERVDRQARNLIDFAISDFHNYKEVENWPSAPEGCGSCYYLYGV